MVNDANAQEPVNVADPLDEVLQQVSELTLRTNHLDAALKDVAQAVGDLGETTHTGLVEIRGLVVQGHAETGTGEGWRAINERLDGLEIQAAGVARKQLLILVLLLLMFAFSALGLAFGTGLLGAKKKSEDFTFPPPPPQNSLSPPLTPAPPIVPPPLIDSSKTPGKDAKAAKHHTKH